MSGRYRLVRPMGAGGMAEVHLGIAEGEGGFERPVAIKRVHAHLAKDPRVVEMFMREVRLSMHLHHQNIVQVLDVGRSDEGLFLVMELVDGWDLAQVQDVLLRPPRALPTSLLLHVAVEVATALSYALRRTRDGKPLMVAHRDISGSNVLLSREGEVKLTDFGIAKVDDGLARTEPGFFKGKLPYAAPEVLAGAPPSFASDQFALGVLLYELAESRHPFCAAESVLELVQALASAGPPVFERAPAPVAEILTRMLARDPRERFAAPEALVQHLARGLTGLGEPASSEDLARYLQTLPLPPPITERRPEGPAPAPLAFALQGGDSELRTQPGSRLRLAGPQRVDPAPRQDVAATVSASASAISYDPMADSPDEWLSTGKSLDESGALRGPPGTSAPSPADPLVPSPPPLEPSDDTLELETTPWTSPLTEQASPLEAPDPTPELTTASAHRRTWVRRRAIAAMAVIGVACVGLVLAGSRLLRTLPEAAARPVVAFVSEPEGAAVRVEGKLLGQTPLYLENLYGDAPVHYELSAPGYLRARGTFQGGAPARVKVKLNRGGAP